ncbi:hypothetical protein [Mycolicibacterium phlei]
MTISTRSITLLLGAGAVAAAIASAPSAGAASVVTSTNSDRANITQRPGHVAIEVLPPDVRPPMIWGPSSTPTFLLGD